MKKVLVACEESQRVCIAFRGLGIEAYSCDILPCSGGHPEWHIKGDVSPILSPMKHLIGCPNYPEYDNFIEFQTMDYKCHSIPKWDLIIAHPPCTYLTVTGNRWFNVEKYGEKAIEREREREKAVNFFMRFINADCKHIAVENPIGIISTCYRKPDQIIQPWQFGHPTTKKTCLWLKGLPPLKPTNVVEIDTNDVYAYVAKNGRIKHDSRSRSKTFYGIAAAMADQWGKIITEG